MADVLNTLRAAALAWARRANELGWLPADAAYSLDDALVATPGELFDAGGGRPLVAALFGGTGVGKSTLMNRLAGEPVARAGAERPTSRDVTIYAHRGAAIERLSETLPLERVRTALHGNERWRDVLWLDMPDVDSIETTNRELVLRWLPHVDVLLYVVSPERYRDDEGWRLLLEHGMRHAWLFVINHWDRGDERQLADLRALLVAAGLDDPLIFRTDSSVREGAHAIAGDDFAELEATLAALADRQLIGQLEARGVRERARELRARSDALHARLGDADRLAALPADWERDWAHESATLEEALGWRIEVLVGTRRAPRRAPARLLGKLPVGVATEGAAASDAGPPVEAGSLFDEETLARIDDAIERFVQRAADAGTLPLAVARRLVTPLRTTLAERLPRLVDDALQRSLATPGERWQRIAYRFCGVLTGLLPLLAMLWIGWRVFAGFLDGGTNPAAYLGSDFAVNGALLLGLAWLLPWFLQRRLRPSHERAAARGLQAGVARALEEVRLAVGESLATAVGEREALDANHAALWGGAGTDDTTDRLVGTPLDGETDVNPAASGQAGAGVLPERVRRMLFDTPPSDAQRAAGVRASTQSSTDTAPVS